jgi:hypothetical protein
MSKISKKNKTEKQLDEHPNQSEYERVEKTRLIDIGKSTDFTQFYLDKDPIDNKESFFDDSVLSNHVITDTEIIKDKNNATNTSEMNTGSIPDVKIIKRQHEGDQ